MAADFHVGQVGAQLVVVVVDEDDDAIDVSGLTKRIRLRKPGRDNETVDLVAVNDTDGTDGAIRYTTAAITDLDRAGPWVIQGYVYNGAGTVKYPTREAAFLVRSNVIDPT